MLNKVVNFLDNLTKPRSFENGEDFENFVSDEIFPDNYYTLVHQTHSYRTNNKRFVESSLMPDFIFRDKMNGREFYLEVKMRTTLYNGGITWSNDEQLKRYLEYDRQLPVFIALGYQDEKYDNLFIFPLNKCPYKTIFLSKAEQYRIAFDSPIKSNTLWNLC